MRAVVSAPLCPLYTQPDRRAPLADEVLCGWPLEVLEEPVPGWLRVRTHYRYEGFAPVSCLALGEGCAQRWSQRPKAVVRAAAADVLREPQVSACRVDTLPRGALPAPIGAPDGEGWRRVCLPDGREGYAREHLLGPHVQAPVWEGLRERVIASAMGYLGVQYRWGGKSPQGVDCSGLVFMAYFLNGLLLYRDAKMVAGFPVEEIPQAQMAPADLLFFPGHVALYLGEGRYLHATARTGSDGVVVNSLNPEDPDYRADLAQGLTAVGSVFPQEP